MIPTVRALSVARARAATAAIAPVRNAVTARASSRCHSRELAGPARRSPDSLVAIVNRRPKLTIVAPDASPEEAAAVVAALERFMRETAPPPAQPAPQRNPW